MVVTAGCGSASPPKLVRADAAPLIALTHRIAAETGCTQARDIHRLRTEAIALVNRGRVPQALQEPMLSGVEALAELAPSCPGGSA